jgi:hypothetical protein
MSQVLVKIRHSIHEVAGRGGQVGIVGSTSLYIKWANNTDNAGDSTFCHVKSIRGVQ